MNEILIKIIKSYWKSRYDRRQNSSDKSTSKEIQGKKEIKVNTIAVIITELIATKEIVLIASANSNVAWLTMYKNETEIVTELGVDCPSIEMEVVSEVVDGRIL